MNQTLVKDRRETNCLGDWAAAISCFVHAVGFRRAVVCAQIPHFVAAGGETMRKSLR